MLQYTNGSHLEEGIDTYLTTQNTTNQTFNHQTQLCPIQK